jgi:hypothetical protein
VGGAKDGGVGGGVGGRMTSPALAIAFAIITGWTWAGGGVGCGPSRTGTDGDAGANSNQEGDGFVVPPDDEDGDYIADYHEGRDIEHDTDGDGTPDYRDQDSDDDGIPDSAEAGDTDLQTPPRDTDGDAIPDFRDADSDNDGIPDNQEDTNGNGVVDPGETDPYAEDTDGDGVTDLIEDVAGTDPNDPADNPEAHGNFVFLVPFQEPAQPPEDDLRFRTNISKVDLYFLEDISVSMQAELQDIHDNVVTILEELTCDPGENHAGCPADCAQTCGDHSCDAGESALNCPSDCVGTCGDSVCLATETPDTCATDCPLSCGDGTCDGAEGPAACPSDCPGTCGDGICAAGEQPAITACIPDLWSGAGAFGTTSNQAACHTSSSCDPTGDGNFVYENLLDVQPDAASTQAALPSWCWGVPCWEPGLAATFYTVTGMGSQSAIAAGYTVPTLPVAEPMGCPYGYRGYPCFRPDSLPIILLIGDEEFKECYLPDGASLGDCVSSKHSRMTPRDFPIVSGAVNDLGAKVIGIQGAGGGSELRTDFETLCQQTGSVDANGDPYVFDGADANAGQAIADGIRELTSSLPLDMAPEMVDDDTDSVDTLAAFLDHLETHTPGTPECIQWPDLQDADGDGYNEKFIQVTAGLPVCWKIHVKQNTTVQPTTEIQVFRAELHLWGNGVTLLDTRTVWFVVPPNVSGPIID